MWLDGWDEPVVVDLAGLDLGQKSHPALLNHDPDEPVGHFEPADLRNTGRELIVDRIVASAATPARDRVVGDAANGFPWELSIGARGLLSDDGRPLPGVVEFHDEGERFAANGRTFTGPKYVLRRSALKVISYVVHGASGGTYANLAARQGSRAAVPAATGAQDPGRPIMEFAAWLQEHYGLDEAAYNALPEQTQEHFRALYEEENPSAGDGAGDGAESAGADAEKALRIEASRRRLAKLAAKEDYADIPAGEREAMVSAAAARVQSNPGCRP